MIKEKEMSEVAEITEIIKKLDSSDTAMLLFGAKILLLKKEMQSQEEKENRKIKTQ